ncbi:hypothetical protein [Lysinibacillus sp. NPDC086135]|uniref:hypothetical protein n=1 Tax=Lysinibacillus sp. NPDC086135 TaxID=3364130 RepID=UPI00380193A3
MKKRIIEQLSKLLGIRNVIAILVTILFVILSLTGVLQVEFIQSIILAVIIFFFAKGTTYDEARKGDKDEYEE